jgi:hypothetical protein
MIPSWKMLRWRKIQDLSFYECGATPDSRFAFVFAGSGKSHVHVLAGQSTLISAERTDGTTTVARWCSDRAWRLPQGPALSWSCERQHRPFPLAPGAVDLAVRTTPRWLPALAVAAKLKCAVWCGNDATENVGNTSGEKSFGFMNKA